MIQGLLTLALFKAPDLTASVTAAQAANPARGVQLVGTQLLQPAMTLTGTGRGRGGANLTPEQQEMLERGATIYNELCSVCHGADGRGTPGVGDAMKAPSFVGSSRVQGHRDYVIRTILHGMLGPLDGRTYTDVMIPMGTNRDEWVAAAATHVRTNFGNTASSVTAADVARVRSETKDRKAPWTQPELEASVAMPLVVQGTWKVSASHNTETASGGLNFQGWSTGVSQRAGMWYQLELPEPALLTEVQFNSTMQAARRNVVPGGRGDVPGAGQPTAPPVATFPRGYKLEVSMDGHTWSPPVAEGQGSGSTTVIVFRPVRAKSVRITQTASVENAPAWTIQRLRLYLAPRAATPD
jgi:mono/diheme cytochrome c family protein